MHLLECCCGLEARRWPAQSQHLRLMGTATLLEVKAINCPVRATSRRLGSARSAANIQRGALSKAKVMNATRNVGTRWSNEVNRSAAVAILQACSVGLA
jgi:hypothetical protein